MSFPSDTKFASSALSAKDKFVALSIVTLPFTFQYASPISVMSFGEFLLIPILFICMYDRLNGRKDTERFNYCGLYVYFAVSALTSLVAMASPWFSFSEFSTMFARLIFYALVIYFVAPRFSLNYGMNMMSVLALFFSIYLIMQWYSGHYLEYHLPTCLNYDFIFGPEADGIRTNLGVYYLHSFRASSLFLEPSYFTFFVGVPLAYQLLAQSEKTFNRSILFAVVITIALALSASSSGLVVGAIAWALFFFRSIKRNKMKRIEIDSSHAIAAILLILLLVVLLSSPLASQLLQRTSGGASIGPRVLNSIETVGHMGTLEKITGVGINNLDSYISYEDFVPTYDNDASQTFVSLLFSSLIYSGVFGFAALILFYISSLIRSHGLFGKAVCIQFIILSVYSSLQFSSNFAFLVIVILAVSNTTSCEFAHAVALRTGGGQE